MEFNDHFKHPRLFIKKPLKHDEAIALEGDQLHYLKNVMRKNTGDQVRLFNGQDGEWLAVLEILGKKEGLANPKKQFKPQPEHTRPLTLIFAPIKKKPMDFMIEKAVELGVTDLYPVITARTENRKLNADKLRANILEATEQCERMTLATLHEPRKLSVFLNAWSESNPIYWAAERKNSAQPISQFSGARTFLIGPEGGFDDTETHHLESVQQVHPIDLGEQILRAETAALFCLSHAKLNT